MVRTIIALIVLLLTPVFSAAAPYHNEPKVTQLKGLGIYSDAGMKPNGEFFVYVFRDGKWKEAGSLSYDRFFREKKTDLKKHFPDGKTTKIKVVQKGGGAAHIDAVSFQGMPPSEIKGCEEGNALKKVSVKDFDVIDAYKKSFEFVFDVQAKSKSKILALTARVESTAISQTPFQFPSENLYTQMDVNSKFYSYKIIPPASSITKGGDEGSPFFKEFSRTGSGHPSGFTYGWVRNDAENLYVTIDFTPDNTMDGEKDYAKVYVKTGSGLKEFKVSVPETKWGTPHFKYTDKVSYQHKVYEFKIPFKELGLNGAEKKDEIKLAFAAYGTATPAGDHNPSIVHDPYNNRYLVVYGKYDDTLLQYDVYGQLIKPDGTAYGSEFVISNAADNQFNPAAAYDSANQKFLVAWQDSRNIANWDIYGQLVNVDGALYGTNFVISNNADNQFNPAAAYDSANQRFLVAWEDFRDLAGVDIYGQLVNADGTLYGTASNANFVISNVADNQYKPVTAYDSANQRFLVAWEDFRSGAGFDIYGQLVNAGGTLYGTVSNANFVISDAANSQYGPATTYDITNRRFLVVWQDFRSGASNDIYGQLVNTDGTLYGTNLVISNNAETQYAPATDYDSANQRFLVAWEDFRSSVSYDIYGQFVNADGAMSGGNFSIYSAAGEQRYPSVAYNYNTANFLVSYSDLSFAPVDIVFSLVGNINSAPSTPQLVYPLDNDTGIGTSATLMFKKSADPDGDTLNYYLYLSTNQNFSGTTPVQIASVGNKAVYYAGAGGWTAGLLLFGIVFTGVIKRKKSIYLAAGLLLLSLIAISCGGGGGGGGSAGGVADVLVKVGQLESGTGKVLERIPSIVSSIGFKISAAGMQTIERTVSITGSTVEERFSVPAGINRHFEVFAYDSSGTMRYKGDRYIDIAGSPVTLSISMAVVAAADEISYTVSGLAPGTVYYWKIVVEDSKGGRSDSDTRSFTTQ